MTYLAYRNLWQNKLRLFLSVGGVALAMMLIILLSGFLSGINEQVTAYLDNTPADLIIAQDGVTNLLGATSLLPAGATEQALGVRGVVQVMPIISQFVIFDLHDKKVVAYMVGYDEKQGGGPWRMKSGQLPDDDDEVVLDWVMAEEHGLKVGDTLDILDDEFTIVGLSDGTNSWMASFFFVTRQAAEQLLLTSGRTSFVLLTLDADANAEEVETRLRRRMRNMEILPASTMKQNDLDVFVKVFAAPLQMMVTISFAVGTAILGMIIYTATVERAKEYGVLKAVGTRNRQLYGLVILQGLSVSLLGVIIGIGLAWLAAQGIMRSSPKFLIVMEPGSVMVTSLSGLLMGVVAALLPARQIAGVDPAVVFRK